MLRKLALGALVLAAGRGTVGQLSVAILFSFAFFALQMGTMPYKSFEDNMFRATTELHVLAPPNARLCFALKSVHAA